MNYQVKISAGDGCDDIRIANDAVVVGLPDEIWDCDSDGNVSKVAVPDTFIHFGHLISRWTDSYPAQACAPVDKFYGGMGEGREFDNWQDAILASLYDLFQVCDQLHNGDTFTATYRDETQVFRCDGIHVVMADTVTR